MSVLKWAECHVTLANEGAFSVPRAPRSPSELASVDVRTTSAHGASYSWPTCQGFWLREIMF